VLVLVGATSVDMSSCIFCCSVLN